jgi:hypothetical protein
MLSDRRARLQSGGQGARKITTARDGGSEGLKLLIRSTGNFSGFQVSPLMTSTEFKEAMEKAKNVKSGYTPPTATKQ